MKELTRVNHIGLRVSSFEAATSFYGKLGFEYVAGPSGPEPVAIVEHPCGININFILNASNKDGVNVLMDTQEKLTGYTHVALEVSNINAVIENLTAMDIPLSGGPMNHPTGTSIFIRDPDRNVIEFIEYMGTRQL
ncbi:VOC family protein [Enterovibrio nigricans]|uniref:Lactoylglutathione lyase n=1 Tax=Enterovibrio nigricans DSM 22720 TaxID=1121868 RepID=A0A1T4W0B2_9GAMM|nr:VOC family protein [Enterovibrio nigricans]SKA70702.1 lactoylglutathione lyase [Enterovibrio nigricans DSM 22720]